MVTSIIHLVDNISSLDVILINRSDKGEFLANLPGQALPKKFYTVGLLSTLNGAYAPLGVQPVPSFDWLYRTYLSGPTATRCTQEEIWTEAHLKEVSSPSRIRSTVQKWWLELDAGNRQRITPFHLESLIEGLESGRGVLDCYWQKPQVFSASPGKGQYLSELADLLR